MELQGPFCANEPSQEQLCFFALCSNWFVSDRMHDSFISRLGKLGPAKWIVGAYAWSSLSRSVGSDASSSCKPITDVWPHKFVHTKSATRKMPADSAMVSFFC